MSTTTAALPPTAGSPMPFEARVEAMNRALEALSGFADSLTGVTLEQLVKAPGVLDRVAVLAAAGRVAVAAARAHRSVPVGRARTARTAEWVREHAPS